MTEIPMTWLITALTSIAIVPLVRSERLPVAGRWFLCLGLAFLGAIGFLLGVRLSFGAPWALAIQPFVAVFIPPAFALGFAALTKEDPYPWRQVLARHGAVAALAVLGVAMGGADVVLPVLTLSYLVVLIRLYLHKDEAFLHLSASDIHTMRSSLLIVIVLFLLVTLGDLTILAAFALGGHTTVLPLVSGGSGIMTVFVFLVALIGLPMLLARQNSVADHNAVREAPSEADRALLGRFDALLRDTALYGDSGLSLARSARRLGVPARALSRAVNRGADTNFSRHVNSFRVSRAQQLLLETDLPVTDIMLEVGFLSKSTFNTEFRRITGQSPSEFRAIGE